MSEHSERAGRPDVARVMADAALALLDSLDAEQRAVTAWPFDDDERTRWYYTPTDHGGLPLSAMRPAQQRLALRLVASGLSHPGYVTVATIIGLDNVLDAVEGWTALFHRERGRDPGLYYVRVFGDPASSAPWSWRFGGHHVSIQHTVIDGEVASSTPCFLGADPASSPLLGPHPLRPLAGVEDLGRELARSLDDEQRAQAVLSPAAPTDLVSGNRPRFGQGDGDLPLPLPDIWRGRFTGELGERMRATQERAEREAGLRPEHLAAVRLTTVPKGVAAGALRADQRELLRALLDLYVERVPDALADAERSKYADDPGLNEVAFAWAGSMEPGQGHYYRVQGRRMLVEYDNTQRGANHVHSVWRDIGGDFGFDPLAEHLRRDH